LAAAQTLKSLHAQGKDAVTQAYGLVTTMVIGGLIGFAQTADYAWQESGSILSWPS